MLILFVSRFMVHRLYHRTPWLWRFHQAHHSATILTPLTLYRVHTIEYTINLVRSLLVVGTISGLFMYCFSGAIGIAEVLGVNIFNFLFNLSAANLSHSQIHYSREAKHFNKNFGSCLAIWDKLFASWVSSVNTRVKHFGL